MSIIFKTDEEIQTVAEPLWQHLVNSSNEGQYGEFVKHFAKDFAKAMNQVQAGHQFANSELARNLDENAEFLGTIRRGDHVTVLYKQKSKAKPGEWLGRMVLGTEDGETRIFGASIF